MADRSGGGAGDTAAVLDRLFDEHYERLVVSLSVAAGSREVARDAVQEAFVSAHLRWKRVAGLDDPVGWIRRAAVNRILNHHRSVGRGRRAMERLKVPGGQVTRSDPAVERVDVQRALEELSVRQRMAVALHYLEGMTVAEAADTMGVSAGSVKTYLHRARERLRVLLEVSG